jgi:hypothetical protein
MISLTACDQSVETFQNRDGVTATALLEKLRGVKSSKKVRLFLEKQATEQPIIDPNHGQMNPVHNSFTPPYFKTFFHTIIPSTFTLSSDRARHRDRKTEVPLCVEA